MLKQKLMVTAAIVTAAGSVGQVMGDCTYNGATYTRGARVCMNGYWFVCGGSSWDSTGQACRSDTVQLPPNVVELARKAGLDLTGLGVDNGGQADRAVLPNEAGADQPGPGKFVRTSGLDHAGNLLILRSDPTVDCNNPADSKRVMELYRKCFGKETVASTTIHCYQVLAVVPYRMCQN